MQLTAENTAIVVDSTADFPEGPDRFGNWRMVPLYVRFGDDSYRDYVELGPAQFYALLGDVAELPRRGSTAPVRDRPLTPKDVGPEWMSR